MLDFYDDDEIDFATAGFDLDDPGQFLVMPFQAAVLRIVIEKSKGSRLLAQINKLGTEVAFELRYDLTQPRLVLMEWQGSQEDIQRCLPILEKLSLRAV